MQHESRRLVSRQLTIALALFGVALGAARGAAAQTPPAASAPAGEVRVECPVVADATLSALPPVEPDYNDGAAPLLRLLGSQRFAALRFDLSGAAGLEVTGATLRCQRAHELLVRVGVSTISDGDWHEGSNVELKPQVGSVCYNAAAYADRPRDAKPWAGGGSTFADVTFGNGGSRWATVVAKFDKATRFYEIPIPLELVQAMLQGAQRPELCLADDFGRTEPTSAILSRESPNPPVLILTGRAVAGGASAAPAGVVVERDAVGMEWLTFQAPRALGFEAYLSERPVASEADLAGAKRLPNWAMPAPGLGALRCEVSIHREPAHRYVAVRAMDRLAGWSAPVSAELPRAVSGVPEFGARELPRYELPRDFDTPFIIDDGPAVSRDGRWIRSAGQTWWDSRKGPVSLQAGRGEFVSFQVVLCGGQATYSVSLGDWRSPGAAEPAPQTEMSLERFVRARLGQDKFAPDPLTPYSPGAPLTLDLWTPPPSGSPAASSPSAESQPAAALPGPPDSAAMPRAFVQTVWIDVYVPHGAAPGTWSSRAIVVRDGAAVLDMPVELEVVAADLPDTLGFAVSLGDWQTPAATSGVRPDAPEGWALLEEAHRLAHAHRATLAVLPYQPDGSLHPGFAPGSGSSGDPAAFDWTAWDEHFGRYLDGSAFRGSPRAGVPVAHFVLPVTLGWPATFAPKRAAGNSPLAGKYHHRATTTEPGPGRRPGPPLDSYLAWPIETAMGEEYPRALAGGLRNILDHVHERGWSQTEFQLSLQMVPGAREKASWWVLRNPQTIDDVGALRYWCGLFRDQLSHAPARDVRVRVDLERPEQERGLLSGLADRWVLGSPVLTRGQYVATRPELRAGYWASGEEVDPELGWSSILRWVWAARLVGARGVALHHSLGSASSWGTASAAAMIYPRQAPGDALRPSLRLKALRRAQQDVEWIDRWLARSGGADVPEGYKLAIFGSEVIRHTHAKVPYWTTYLPTIELPARLDTVSLEEIRRALRGAR